MNTLNKRFSDRKTNDKHAIKLRTPYNLQNTTHDADADADADVNGNTSSYTSEVAINPYRRPRGGMYASNSQEDKPAHTIQAGHLTLRSQTSRNRFKPPIDFSVQQAEGVCNIANPYDKYVFLKEWVDSYQAWLDYCYSEINAAKVEREFQKIGTIQRAISSMQTSVNQILPQVFEHLAALLAVSNKNDGSDSKA